LKYSLSFNDRNPIGSTIIVVPLLYSPLYQSIRLILFGALGLTSLTVSAALNPVDNNVDAQTTEPLITENSSDATLYTLSTEKGNQTQSGTADANNKALNSQLTTAPVFNNDDVFTSDNVNITAINDSSDRIDVNNNAVNNATKTNNTTAPVNNSSTAKSNKRSIDVNDESIQDSLIRLAEFYELTPDTDPATLHNNSNDDVADSNNSDIQNSFAAQTVEPVGNDLKLLPNSVDSAQRCEGQWVYPKKNPNYQRAINETGAPNGQPAPNLNGIPNNQAPLFAESDYGYYDNVD